MQTDSAIFMSKLDINPAQKYNLTVKQRGTEYKMKKTIRILIPFILAVTIVLCLAWYLFVYDRAFTRVVLLSCARYCEGQGNHSVAAWFYDKAYAQASDNDAVAIELAEQYKTVGNYTKAEYTLSTAIADGGGLDLYVALCKTYVEQDKLLDAVNMLSSVTNAQIKAQLENLRPQAPTATPEPAFYSQYISVAVTSESGTLYVTTDGEYPSIQDSPYSQPITLTEGENTLYAISVADNGLVSPLSIFGYTVGGVVELVEFEDAAVESAVRSALGVDTNTELYTNDLWSLTEFSVPGNAASFADIKHMVFLESLTIQSGATGDLRCLSSLVNLSKLHINGVTVSQEVLGSIAALPKLTELTLQNCGISNVSSLAAAKNLVYLDLSSNTVRDVSALSVMVHLQQLYLQNNAIVDVTPLSSLSALVKLNLSSNAVASIAPLSNITGLTWLDVNTNSISELGEMSQFTALSYLCLNNNSLTDITKLSGSATVTELYISNNKLTDITALSSLTKLLYLDVSYNQLTALPSWPAEAALISIDCSHNKISSLDPLGGMKHLNNVYADYNEAISSVKALADCPMLIQVNVYGTKVTNVSALTDQSIIVNYNPVQ